MMILMHPSRIDRLQRPVALGGAAALVVWPAAGPWVPEVGLVCLGALYTTCVCACMERYRSEPGLWMLGAVFVPVQLLFYGVVALGVSAGRPSWLAAGFVLGTLTLGFGLRLTISMCVYNYRFSRKMATILRELRRATI